MDYNIDDKIKFTSQITVNLIQTSAEGNDLSGDEMIAAAAWASSSGAEARERIRTEGPAKVKGLINSLMRNRHGTPFEHGSLTIYAHIPIFVMREWVRHRIGWSLNEESGRYKQLDPVFWIPRRDRPLMPEPNYKPMAPKFVAASDEEYAWFVDDLKNGYRDDYIRYQERLDRGYAKEAARAGLPVGIYTSGNFTCNPRSCMAFLSLRKYDPEALFVSHPQAEIEEAADSVELLLKTGWPLTHAAFVKNRRVGP